MIKFRWYYDKDREEGFLNNMVTKGYAMKSYFLGFYSFEKCEPGEYTYRVDITSGKGVEYCNLICETGGEIIDSWGVWTFFRKKGTFELYTDNESRIQQYRKIQKTFLSLAICESIMLISSTRIYFNDNDNTSLYLSIILGIICIAFFYQVYKCKRKIASLKKESE